MCAVVLVLVCVSARAADCESDAAFAEGYVTKYTAGADRAPQIQRVGSAVAIEIRSGSCLQAKDKIMVPALATVEIITRNEPGGHVVKPRESPYDITAGSALPNSPSFLASLRVAVSHIAKDFPVTGGVNPSKGAGDCDSNAAGSALHAAAALSLTQQEVVNTRSAVSIAWAGGLAPYHVTVTRGAKVVTNLTDCSGMVADLSIGATGPSSVRITVTDTAKASITWSLVLVGLADGATAAYGGKGSGSDVDDQSDFERALSDLVDAHGNRGIEGFTSLNRLSDKYFPALMLVRAVANEVPLK